MKFARVRLAFVFEEFAAGAAKEVADEVGGVDAAFEVGVLEDGELKGDGGFDALDHKFVKGAGHNVHGFGAIFAISDKFADHRVVVGRDGVAGVDVRFEANASSAGGVKHFNSAGRRAEAVKGVFGVDAAFDGVSGVADFALGDADGFAGGDEDLEFDEVSASDFFGDGVFDLDAFVDFEEVEVAFVVNDEFDRAGVGVLGHFTEFDSGAAGFFADISKGFAVEQRGGGFFDELLVAPLNGAVSLAKVEDFAFAVAEDLDFDVVGVFDEFFDVDVGVAKALLGFAAGGVIALAKRDVVVNDAHASAAAASDGFNHCGIADFFCGRKGVFFGVHGAGGAGRNGDAGFFGEFAADGLVFEGVHGGGAGADETNVATSANFSELGVFRKESVARMNGVDVGNFGGADEAVNSEIAFESGRFADANGFVGHLGVHGVSVGLGIDGDGANVEFPASSNDAHGNFAAVGDQNFLKHWRGKRCDEA